MRWSHLMSGQIARANAQERGENFDCRGRQNDTLVRCEIELGSGKGLCCEIGRIGTDLARTGAVA